MCDFNINFKGHIEDLINKAKTAIEKADGALNGDTQSGSFEIPTGMPKEIEGRYTVSGQTVHFDITRKPIVLSCDKIKEELEKYLEKPAIETSRNV